jgi:2-polyprenyl-3-methyl-5-hydroxy-6-metoxy-1,4-benzoquinol methylase
VPRVATCADKAKTERKIMRITIGGVMCEVPDAAYYNLKNHAEDLAEYLGDSAENLIPIIADSSKLIADDWNEHAPQGGEQIHKWYCDTPLYLFELCAYHANSPTYPLVTDAIERICSEKGGRILDFGGGDGDMALKLVRRGLNVEYCDVPGKTMEFAKWRFNKYGFDIKCISSDEPNVVPIDGQYDVILCMDVLEHLVNPMAYCLEMYKHLYDRGIFITRPSFSHDELHPMHLLENIKYALCFNSEMEDIGFEQIPSDGTHIGVWVKRHHDKH